jgi:hypothetical protein
VRGEPRPDSCRPGSALLFAWGGMTAAQLFQDKRGASVDLRWIGGATFVFTALCVLLLAVLLRRHPPAAFLHGLTVLLVLGDPMVGLWFNTMYAESATLLGVYLVVGLLVAIALRRAANAFLWSALCAGIVLLGLSKHQFFALPLLLFVMALPALWHAGRRGTGVVAAAALVAFAAFFLPGNEGAIRANRFDTYLLSLAAASDDPPRTIAGLGLPRRCEVFIGTSYYRLRGENPDVACPEVFALPATAFVPLALREPRTLAVAMARALAPSQAVFYQIVGVLQGTPDAGVEALAPWARTAWKPLFEWLRPSWYAGLALFMLAVSLVAFVFAGWRAASAPGVLAGYAAMLAACYGYAFVTTVLGDGGADAGKQSLAGSIAFAAWCIALPGLAVVSVTVHGNRWMRAIVVIGWIAGIALAAWGALLYREQRLAMGKIDSPLGNTLAGSPLAKGWVLDPVGVASVEATLDGRPVAVRSGLPTPGPAHVYPNFPRGERGGFEAVLPGDPLTPGVHELRVYAVNRLGVRTEVDRRRLLTSP